jgi:hypothetical protein
LGGLFYQKFIGIRPWYHQLIPLSQIEIYVHTKNERGREGFHVSNYEAPTEFYIDLDTTNEREIDTFKKLRKDLGI